MKPQVLMFKGYFDETEKDGLFLIGGFVGDEDQWNKLETTWKETRGERRIHLSDMRKNTSTATILRHLGPLPYRAGLIPHYVSIRPGDYRDMLRTDGERLVYNPYPVCLQMLLSFLNRKISKEESIKSVFEQNDLYDAHACVIFEKSESFRTSSGEARFPSWEFFAKDACHIIEVADYFAYAMRERINDPNSPEAIWSAPILDAFPQKPEGYEWKREDIRRGIETMRATDCDFGAMMSDYLKEIRRARHPKRQAKGV